MPYPLANRQPALTSLTTASGFRVTLVDVGCAIQTIDVPGRDGPRNVALRYASTESYADNVYCLGSTIGRYANRLREGRLVVGDATYQLATDPGTGHCLHGGPGGFHRQHWDLDTVSASSASYRYISRDGDQGFPGQLSTSIRYTVTEPATLTIDFEAVGDKLTAVSLTNHCYFNLHGEQRTIDGHTLRLNADHYLPVDDELLPLGHFADVAGSRFDFTSDRPLPAGERFDVCYALNEGRSSPGWAAILTSPHSGLQLIVRTTQPALQFYTGDYLGQPLAARHGLCLEAQHFPDAPNCAAFPSALLEPGDVYRQQTVYEFRDLAE